MKKQEIANKSIIYEILEDPHTKKVFYTLRRNYIIRLSFLYLLPLLILILFFLYQFNNLMNRSRESHLLSIAESKSRIMDIYLMERVNNIINIIESSELSYPIDQITLDNIFNNLKKHSEAFTDIGYFDTTTIQKYFSGPLTYLINKDYQDEPWFKQLVASEKNYIITDVYLGFRNVPHFTIGVKRYLKGKRYIFKVSLDPQLIYSYMTSTEKSKDVNILIINNDGNYQLTPQDFSGLMDTSYFHPPKDKNIGVTYYNHNKTSDKYAFAWLNFVNWAVITTEKEESKKDFSRTQTIIIITSFAFLLFVFFIILIRSKNIVDIEKDKISSRMQLEQASKLATVGELAAGIAHEIGNPLNIIANEIGIMQDYANPQFKVNKTIQDLEPHFQKVMNAVYRIKDINKKLLSFVRRNENIFYECNINEIVEDFLSGFFERELKLENIEIIKKFDKNIPNILCDGNQLRQVIINILNNARDAISGKGQITITTNHDNQYVYLIISDTGRGIPPDKLDKVFLPFYTTKPVGKGTGLGLSVSYNIIKGMGGRITVESEINKSSTFTISLPIENVHKNI